MASTTRWSAESVKACGQQLEDHRAVLELAPQAAERRSPGCGGGPRAWARPAAGSQRGGPGVRRPRRGRGRPPAPARPRRAVRSAPAPARRSSATPPRPKTMSARCRRSGRRAVAGGAHPGLERRRDHAVDHRRPACAPVLPGEEPHQSRQRASHGATVGLAHQRQVGHRDVRAVLPAVSRRIAVAVAEGVELLDVAEPKPVCSRTQPRRPSSRVRSRLRLQGTERQGVFRSLGAAGAGDRRMRGTSSVTATITALRPRSTLTPPPTITTAGETSTSSRSNTSAEVAGRPPPRSREAPTARRPSAARSRSCSPGGGRRG